MEFEGAWGTEAKACKRLGAMGWMSQALGSVVGWELQVLGSVVLGAGICACEGELRALSDLPARKNDVRLRFNSASGSSLKSCKPSTCGFINAICPMLNPRDLKRKRAGFFWVAWGCRSARVACEPTTDRLRAVIGAFFDVTNPSDNRI